MPARAKLDAQALIAKLRAVVPQAVDKAAQGMVGHVRQKIGVSARIETPPSRRARLQEAKAKRRKAARFLFQPSRPGEPPRKRTGMLQRSIAHAVELRGDKVVARVGSNVPYARALEFGYSPRNLAARPYLEPSLREYAPAFGRVVATELRRRFGGRR